MLLLESGLLLLSSGVMVPLEGEAGFSSAEAGRGEPRGDDVDAGRATVAVDDVDVGGVSGAVGSVGGLARGDGRARPEAASDARH